jgi:dephospho-CoA kinase
MRAYLIGLTGGVASGKSTVADAFQKIGIAVIDADAAARKVVARGTEGLAAVVDAFGSSVLDASGALDRSTMRRRVFADVTARRKLEQIIHPRVRALLHAESARASGPYAIVAIPLLAESGGRDTYPWLDRILLVDVPIELQLQRLLQRDGIDHALAQRMIDAQAQRSARLAIADDVLVNTGSVEALASQVAALDRQYRAFAAERAV